MRENWISAKGYEGLYQVSDLGNVRSLDRKLKCKGGCYRMMRGRVLRLKKTNAGYLTVQLLNRGRMILVHRLVALSFLENKENKPQVNHIDGDKTNNNLINLEWMTKSENQIHAYENGLQKSNKYNTL